MGKKKSNKDYTTIQVTRDYQAVLKRMCQEGESYQSMFKRKGLK